MNRFRNSGLIQLQIMFALKLSETNTDTRLKMSGFSKASIESLTRISFDGEMADNWKADEVAFDLKNFFRIVHSQQDLPFSFQTQYNWIKHCVQ